MLRTELRPTIIKAQQDIYDDPVLMGQPSLVKGIIAGAVAGLVASYVMNAFQSLTTNILEDRKPDEPNHEQGAQKQKVQREAKSRSAHRTQEPATVVAGRRLSLALLGHRLRQDEKETAGQIMHYAMGVGSAMIYGAAAEEAEIATIGKGIGFGSAVWLFGDEMIVPALKLSKTPDKYAPNVHIKSLAAHFVYGFTTEVIRSVVRKALD